MRPTRWPLRAALIVYVIWHYATVDIYEALRAEHSVKFLRYDKQTSHNTPLQCPPPFWVLFILVTMKDREEPNSINNYPAYFE